MSTIADGDVGLNTKNGFQVVCTSCVVELDAPIQIAVVSDGY
jgi:hypothetical protein